MKFPAVSEKYSRAVLVFIGISVIACCVALAKLSIDLSAELVLEAEISSRGAYDDFIEQFGRDDNIIIIAYEVGQDAVPPEDELERLEYITKEIDHVKGIAQVFSLAGIAEGYTFRPLCRDGLSFNSCLEKASRQSLFKGYIISEDASVVAVVAVTDPEKDGFDEREVMLDEIQQILQERQGPDYRISGIPVFRTELARMLRADQFRYFPLVTILMGGVLLYVFRSVRGMFIPFIAVLIANAWNLAIMSLTGGAINVFSTMLPTLVAVIGMSDSVHFLSYYNERRAAGAGVREAVLVALNHIGAACVLTTVTTIIGFASLYFVQMKIIREFGTYAATGIICALISTLLFVPSALVALRGRGGRKSTKGGLARTFGPVIMRIDSIVRARTTAVIIIGAAIAGLALFGCTRVVTDTKLLEDLKPNNPVARSIIFMQDKLSGVLSVEIVVDAKPGIRFDDPDVLVKIAQVEEEIEQLEYVTKVVSLPDLLGSVPAFFKGVENVAPMPREQAAANAPEYLRWMKHAPKNTVSGTVSENWDRLRISVRITDFGTRKYGAFAEKLEAQIGTQLEEIGTYTITGTARFAGEVLNGLVDQISRGFLFAFAVIFVFMSVHFRSPRLGVLATIPNLLPIVLTLGFIGLAGITLRTSTAVTFVVAFCIAVDDTIHFLTHYRRARADGLQPPEAVTYSMKNAGPAIIITSLIMILGFSVLLTSNFVSTANFGLLTMIIMSAALVGDLFLLPALLIRFDKKDSAR